MTATVIKLLICHRDQSLLNTATSISVQTVENQVVAVVCQRLKLPRDALDPCSLMLPSPAVLHPSSEGQFNMPPGLVGDGVHVTDERSHRLNLALEPLVSDFTP